MAEFPASAQTMVGNNSGACLLHLTGAAITVKFTQTNDMASWPYNCIRQFRADEDTKQFSFFSGRRGPYGVAEYKFDMTEKMLLALQDALTQFTGAQFGQNPSPGTSSGNGTVGMTGGTGGVGFLLDSTRSPKRDPLPQIPGTPPSNQETHAGYTTHRGNFQPRHSATDIFATLPKEPRNRQESLSRPPIPAPYDSHTMDSRGRRGAPSVNTKYTYHEVVGGFSQTVAGRGAGSVVPPPSNVGRKMSHGDEVFGTRTMQSPARNPRLMRQATAPTHRTKYGFEETDSPAQGGVFSPPSAEPADDGTSDLDFGALRRSSPQVDRKNTTRRGRVSPAENSPGHDTYNVPRPSGSTSSPPLVPPTTGGADNLYQVPRPNSVDRLSQESAEIPTSFAISPTRKDNVYSVPKPVAGSEVYSAPRSQRQQSWEETPTAPDVGGSVIYNVPSSRPVPVQQQQHPHPQMVRPPENGELYNTPRAVATNGHDLQNHCMAPATNAQQAPQNGHELYNVPRSALENSRQGEDEALYNVPRSLETQLDMYSVPKPSQTRSSYDTLQDVQLSTDYKANKPGGNPTPVTPHQQNIRQPIPTPENETYSVPRPANPPSPVGGRRGDTTNGRRYPYDYVDHRLPRGENGGELKPSRSLESLVRHRVTLSPDTTPSTQSHTQRAQRTPSPRALQHKYIEIDIDELRETSPSSPSSSTPSSAGKRGRFHLQPQHQPKAENVYAEISDSDASTRRGPHPETTNTPYMNGGHTSVNNTPLPMQQGRMHHPPSNNSSLNVSKEARALHQEGYELVLPAEEAARNRAMQQQKHATLPMNIHRTQSVSASYGRNTHHLANGGHPVFSRDTSFTQFGTSGPQTSGSGTDEYVIVNRRDFNLPPTQPRDIPVGYSGTSSQSVNPGSSSRIIVEDEYEIMSSVKRGSMEQGLRQPQFSMAPSIPSKKRGSIPSTNGTPTSVPMSRGIHHSTRDSLDLDSLETSSRASVGSGSHLDELVGPLSPLDAGAPPIPLPYSGSGPGRKNVIRIASGSPHDITPSKELKMRSNSVENILDADEKNQKYENVTDEDLAAKHALSASQQLSAPNGGTHKKPPMPLPRPARPDH